MAQNRARVQSSPCEDATHDVMLLYTPAGPSDVSRRLNAESSTPGGAVRQRLTRTERQSVEKKSFCYTDFSDKRDKNLNERVCEGNERKSEDKRKEMK